MAYGAIGFYDDYLKVTKQTASGFGGKARLGLEFLVAGLAAWWIMSIGKPGFADALTLPFFKTADHPAGLHVHSAGCRRHCRRRQLGQPDRRPGRSGHRSVMIAAATFGLIAYLTGHAVISKYLQIHYVAGAGELSVICGALIGAGLGFLWFNAPPAMIFMGDTGSLALGGALGSIAVATKHEIVLAIVGGLFVLETMSVIIQVASFKMTGKRVFRMAPLHHHFEQKGWKEPTVVVRFWIISVVLALVGLSTLKLGRAMRRPIGLACALLMATSVAAMAVAEEAQTPVLGMAPTYTKRRLGVEGVGGVPNSQAITRRIWAPGLDQGFVPQGLAMVDGAIYVSAYRSTDTGQSKGDCSLFRIDPKSGAVTGSRPLRSTCGHAGGIARGAYGRIWVVDTHEMQELPHVPGHAARIGHVIRQVRLEPPLKGSFAAGDGRSLWIGSYERNGAGRLYEIPLSKLPQRDGSVGLAGVRRQLVLPPKAQGAAFDAAGWLWITMSGSRSGELAKLDPATGRVLARYAMPAGTEDLSFDADGQIWAVSEAGSRRWSGWGTFFPVLFRLDPARLR